MTVLFQFGRKKNKTYIQEGVCGSHNPRPCLATHMSSSHQPTPPLPPHNNHSPGFPPTILHPNKQLKPSIAGEKASQNGRGVREQADENRPRLATIQKQRVAASTDPLLVGSNCGIKSTVGSRNYYLCKGNLAVVGYQVFESRIPLIW